MTLKKLLNEGFTHKINIYPVITVVYDNQIQSVYEFEDQGQTVEIDVCLKPDEGTVGDKLVQPHMSKIKFDELGTLRDLAFEKFKKEKFLVNPEKLTKDKVSLQTSKAWAYVEEE